MSKVELAWAAGFLDGEGCFSNATGNRSHRLRFSITQCEREPLERFHRILGFGNLNGPYKPQGSQRQPVSRYTANGDDVTRIARLLWPYLSRPKKRQYLSCLSRFRNEIVDAKFSTVL